MGQTTPTIGMEVDRPSSSSTQNAPPVQFVNRKCVLIQPPQNKESFSAETHSAMQNETIDTNLLQPNHVIVQIQAIAIDAFIRVMLSPVVVETDNNLHDGNKSSTTTSVDQNEPNDTQVKKKKGGEWNKVHGGIQVGEVIPAVAMGKIIHSNSRRFPVGRTVSGLLGGQTHAIVHDSQLLPVLSIPGIPLYKFLNLLGLSGLTAHVGLCRILVPPKKGETVVVTAAAGATGSIVAQLAKRRGARVIGVAGGTTKCQMLLQELNLDGAIDYKDTTTRSLKEQFQHHCPKGIDFLYDNVGGECFNEALAHLAPYGRVVICGAISQYNITHSSQKFGPSNYIRLAEQSAQMAGFVVVHYPLGMILAFLHLTWLYCWGHIKSLEQVYHGIDHFPKALQNLLDGGNIGKPIIAI